MTVNAQFRHDAKTLHAIYKQSPQDYPTFNAWLVAQYTAQTGQTEWETYKGWKNKGYQVNKGEKSYPVFARPMSALKAEKGQEAKAGDGKYFPTAYLFHAGQVSKITPNAPTNQPEAIHDVEYTDLSNQLLLN